MNKTMRQVFGETLCALAQRCPTLTVLDCDVSKSTQTCLFEREHPDRFYNFGIAEGNMVAVAAGMATTGLIPVASTFAFLLSLWAADSIRSLIAYNNLNVKLAGGYAGLSDFADGASHQSVMDMAILRAMPNMTVLAPSDQETTIGAVEAMLAHDGPLYLRLSRDAVGSYHEGKRDFVIGRANVLRDGTDVTLAVTGTCLAATLEAARLLNAQGVDAAVVEFGTVKPLDKDALRHFAAKTGCILTIEEHSIIGGLGGAVCEALEETGDVRIKRLGLRDCFGESGPYAALLEKHGLTAQGVAQAALTFHAARRGDRHGIL